MAARADEKLREITDDKKEPEEKEEDMTKQRTCKRCGMPTGATYYKININAECDRAGATTERNRMQRRVRSFIKYLMR